MAIHAVHPRIITPIRYSSLFNATTSDIAFGLASSQNLSAQTCLAYVHVLGDGEGTFGYIIAKTPSASAAGIRLFLGASGEIGTGANSATASTPNRLTATGAVPDATFAHVGMTWDGSITAANFRMFAGLNNAPLSEPTYGAASDGNTSITSDAANNFHLGNREGTDRTFNGVIYYVARWNRVLPLAELRRAQRDGPLSVPDGLVLCWANNQDYSQTRLVYASQAAVVMTGAAPLNPYLQRVPALPTYFNISAGGAVGWGPLLSGARNRLVIA